MSERQQGVKSLVRRVRAECIHAAAMLGAMSAIKGRARRPENTPTVLLQARVNAAIREQLNTAASASGISSGLYLEALLSKTLNSEGQLPVLDLTTDNPGSPIPAT